MYSKTLLAAAALFASPATAQTAPAADDDLECIVFAAFAFEQVPEAEEKIGMAASLGYFIGRYEVLRGSGGIDDAIVARFEMMTPEEFAAIQARCVPRMEAFGRRMQTMGARMAGANKGE